MGGVAADKVDEVEQLLEQHSVAEPADRVVVQVPAKCARSVMHKPVLKVGLGTLVLAHARRVHVLVAALAKLVLRALCAAHQV